MFYTCTLPPHYRLVVENHTLPKETIEEIMKRNSENNNNHNEIVKKIEFVPEKY